MLLKKNTIHISKREVGIVFFVLFFLFAQFHVTYAATVAELQDQIQKVTDTKTQLQKEIAGDEQELKDLGAQSTTLSKTLKSLNATINKNGLDIKLTQSNIDETELQIEQLSQDIGKNSDLINEDMQAIAKLVNQIGRAHV